MDIHFLCTLISELIISLTRRPARSSMRMRSHTVDIAHGLVKGTRNCRGVQAPSQAPSKLAAAQQEPNTSSLQAHESSLEFNERASSLRFQVRCRHLRLQVISRLQALYHKQVPCAQLKIARAASGIRSSSRSGASKFSRASFSLQGATAGSSLFFSSSDVSSLSVK